MLQYRDQNSKKIVFAKPEKDLSIQFSELRDELNENINIVAGTWLPSVVRASNLPTVAGEGQYIFVEDEESVYRFQANAWGFLYKAPKYVGAALASRKSDQFIATANQRVFNLSGEYVPGQGRLDVYVSGVRQRIGEDYVETSPTSFTMTEGVALGLEVEGVYFSMNQAMYRDLKQEVDAAITATNTAMAAADTARFNWKTPVARFADIATTYPNPQPYDAVMVTGTNEPEAGRVYRFETGQWRHRQTVSVGPYESIAAQVRNQREVVNVKDFGAKGDGVTDDSEAIRRAILALPLKGGTLKFPPGAYLHGDGIEDKINGTGTSYLEHPTEPGRPYLTAAVPLDVGRDIRFLFVDYEDLRIEGYGAVVVSHPGNGECRNNSMFQFRNCTDLTIVGITVDGNKNARQPILNDYSDGSGANQRSVMGITGGDRITIKDVTSLNGIVDGISIGGNDAEPATNILLENVVVDNAYRNGVTVSTAENVRILNSRFTNTAKTYGIAPKAGVDIEADWGGTKNRNIVVEGCYFKGNEVIGLVYSVGAVNCRAIGCTFDGPKEAPSFAFDSTRWGYNYVQGCHFIDCGIPTEARGIYYTDNSFEMNPVVAAGADIEKTFMHLQGTDGTGGEAYVFIRDNTFRVNLAGVSATARNVDLGRFWIGDRKNVVVEGNTFVNLYSAGSPGMYVFRIGNFGQIGDAVIRGNVFRFTETRLAASMNQSLIFLTYDHAEKTNFYKDNLIYGYPKQVRVAAGSAKHESLTDGARYMKSMVLDNNAVVAVDPRVIGADSGLLFSHFKVTVFKFTQRAELEVNFTWQDDIKLTLYDELKPASAEDFEVEFYFSGGILYMKTLGAYNTALVELVFSGTANVGMDHNLNLLRYVDASVLTGKTKIQPTCRHATFPTLAATDGLKFQDGHLFYVEDTGTLYIVVDGDKLPVGGGGGGGTAKGGLVIDVTDYGAEGDGVTDDSEALKAAVAAIPATGGTLFFPPGVYIHGDGIENVTTGTGNSWLPTPGEPETPLINTTTSPIDIGRDIRLQFENVNNLTILGYGATIRSHPGNGECRNNSVFTFRNCNKLRVYGITVDGNKANRGPVFIDAGGTNQRGNFQVTATHDVHFKDVTSRGSLMDGFYLAGLDGAETLKGLRVDNCVADDAYRNGLTVSNALKPIIEGGRYINTGKLFGTLPMEGIDFEADWPGTKNEGGVIRDAYFTNNVIAGVGVSFRTHNLTIEGCTFDNEDRSIYYLGVANEISNTTVKGCTFLNCSLGEFIQDATYLDNTVKYNPTVAAGAGNSDIYFLYMYAALENDYVVFKRNKFIVDLTNVSPDASYLNLGRFSFNRDRYEFTDNTIVNMVNLYDFGSHSFNHLMGDTTPESILVKDNKFILADTRFTSLVGSSTFETPKRGAPNRVTGNLLDGYPKSVKLAFEENRFNVANIGQTYKRSELLGYQTVHVIDPAAIAYQATYISHHITLDFVYYNDKVRLDIVMDPDEFTYTMRAFDSHLPISTVPTWLQVWTKDDKILVKANGYFVAMVYESVTTGGNGDGTQRISGDYDVISPGAEADLTGATALQYDFHAPSIASTATGASLRKRTGQSTYITGANKAAWWNGTAWVDATGVVIP